MDWLTIVLCVVSACVVLFTSIMVRRMERQRHDNLQWLNKILRLQQEQNKKFFEFLSEEYEVENLEEEHDGPHGPTGPPGTYYKKSLN